jgi:hypothetical protein
LTLSFSHAVPLVDELNSFGLAALIWDSLEGLLIDAFHDYWFQGVFFAKELAVTSFCPAKGVVHGHGLVHCSPGEASELAERLECRLVTSKAWKVFIKAYRGLVPGSFGPKFDLRTPSSSGGLARALRYALKPHTVHKPYRAAFERRLAKDRWRLNEEVKAVIQGLDFHLRRCEREDQDGTVLYKSGPRIGTRLGTLRWRTRDTVCKPKDSWNEEENRYLVDAIHQETWKD